MFRNFLRADRYGVDSYFPLKLSCLLFFKTVLPGLQYITVQYSTVHYCTPWLLGQLVPSLPHLSGHHIYKVYQVCLQTGNGKWSYRFYPKSKDKRLHVDIDQGNFLCLIDWKFHFRFLFKDLLD